MNLVLTDDAIIKQYIALRDTVAKMAEEFNQSVKPYKDGMDTLENIMLDRLNGRGAGHSSTSTDSGTAYKQSYMSVKCVDRNQLLDWCYTNYQTIGRDMLTANVSKDTLETYLERTKDEAHPDGVTPPGLSLSFGWKVIFRK